ncbi:GDCCVxC domain-containing (seleno)protein [Paraburkholderia atlantica]|uniref:GDCCVxC domain-containing (seleno)protein n=1 Tax=Paraburkholderia atlantica TaxID=2654982 RepID=UPI0009FF99EF|nr:GDCCVxC domain-containing (seleno)protein [Paraburkholderia atlantica]
MQTSPILESALTCPHCRCMSDVTMPTDACVYFYECPSCQTLLSPKPGDCCVFCSYGSVKCPSMQEAGACCAKSVTQAGPCDQRVA